jgi:hypothetical protein
MVYVRGAYMCPTASVMGTRARICKSLGLMQASRRVSEQAMAVCEEPKPWVHQFLSLPCSAFSEDR